MSAGDLMPIRIRLGPGLVDGPSVVARLNHSDGLVVARLDGDQIVLRPSRQPTVGGMPAYYAGRPEFRGRLTQESDGGLTLSGVVRHSDVARVNTLAGGSLRYWVPWRGP